jgi:hypothetical protein
LNPVLTLILALTNIRPRIEELACQKQAQLSKQQVRTTLITDKVFNNIILLCLNTFVPLLLLLLLFLTRYYYLIHYSGCNLFNLFYM